MEVVTTVLTLQIREETGIETEFRSIVAFRHGHNFNFGCSDIYIVVALKPLSEAIHTDQKEIAKCQWMPLQVRSSFIYCTVSKRVLILRTWGPLGGTENGTLGAQIKILKCLILIRYYHNNFDLDTPSAIFGTPQGAPGP